MGGSSTGNIPNNTAPNRSGAAIRTESFTVSIPKGLAAEAVQAAKQLGISRAALVKRALADMIEEMQDVAESNRILADIKSGKEKTYTLAEVKAELGL